MSSEEGVTIKKQIKTMFLDALVFCEFCFINLCGNCGLVS